MESMTRTRKKALSMGRIALARAEVILCSDLRHLLITGARCPSDLYMTGMC